MHLNKNFSKKKAITPAWIHFLSLKYHSHSSSFFGPPEGRGSVLLSKQLDRHLKYSCKQSTIKTPLCSQPMGK